MSGPDGGGGGASGERDGLGLPTSAEVAAPLIERTRVAALNALLNKPECVNLLSPDDSPEPGTLNPMTVINNVPSATSGTTRWTSAAPRDAASTAVSKSRTGSS